MNWMSYSVVAAAVEAFDIHGPVVEYGAYRDVAHETSGVPDLRTLFDGVDYTGIDLNEGPGVDRLGDVTRPDHDDDSLGAYICLDTLEHVASGDFDSVFAPLPRILKPGGLAIVTSVFGFRYHGTDQYVDYWRFSPTCMGHFLEAFPMRLYGGQGRRNLPQMTFALAQAPSPETSDDRFLQQAETFFNVLADHVAEGARRGLKGGPLRRFLRQLKSEHVRHAADLHVMALAGEARREWSRA